jgi:hypothetical protein
MQRPVRASGGFLGRAHVADRFAAADVEVEAGPGAAVVKPD